MRSVLVTGGAGFIGSCFVRSALKRGAEQVIVLDKLTYAGNLDSLPRQPTKNLCFVEGDIADRHFVANLLREHRPQAIVNFAAESHVDRSIDGPLEFVRANVVGTCELLDVALQYWQSLSEINRRPFRFLQVSTDEVYGSLNATEKFSEASPYKPNSPYAASKAAADHFVRAYHRTYRLPTLTTNCSNNYGPYQFPEKLIPLMILNALDGKAMPVYGDGQQVRDWLFVDDHCEAIRVVLEKGTPGSVYNIGGDAERANLDVVNLICDIVDELCPDLPHKPCRKLVTFVPDRPGHDRRYAIDSTKIKTELGWAPREQFETGLRSTVLWYLQNQEWVTRVLSGAYSRERLGVRTSG